jgi:hypothetical protein
MKDLKKQSATLAKEVNFEDMEDVAVCEVLKLHVKSCQFRSSGNYKTNLTFFLRIQH